MKKKVADDPNTHFYLTLEKSATRTWLFHRKVELEKLIWDEEGNLVGKESAEEHEEYLKVLKALQELL